MQRCLRTELSLKEVIKRRYFSSNCRLLIFDLSLLLAHSRRRAYDQNLWVGPSSEGQDIGHKKRLQEETKTRTSSFHAIKIKV